MSTALRICAAAFVLLGSPAPSTAAQPEKPPHIVVILADDLGWNDVGYHGSEIQTPTLDRLAREGVELDRFYVQPSCSPTRAALLTGKSPARFGIMRPLGKNEKTGLPLDETILPQYLAQHGYEARMVGKWHLGNAHPDLFPHRRGFEHFYGFVTGGIGYWDHNHGGGHDWQRDGVTLREEGYATRLLADEAVRVVRERDGARPLFLYFALGAPHLPNEAPAETVALYSNVADEKRRVHAAMVHELDRAIATLLAALEAEGLLANTLLFFSSDNGGLVRDTAPAPLVAAADLALRLFDRPMPFAGLEFLVSNLKDGASENAPLPGGKMSIDEGGARVPAFVWWPGRLEARKHTGFTTIADMLPTLMHAVVGEAAIPNGLDGSSQWLALSQGGEATTPDYLIHGFAGEALYRAPWKLQLPAGTAAPRLYDIYADPLESRDLAAQHPDLVASMRARVEAWPRGSRPDATGPLDALLDPDSFGGPEDREPWADVAHSRAAAAVDSGDAAPDR